MIAALTKEVRLVLFGKFKYGFGKLEYEIA
jgi:hypothetical protein